MKKKKMKELLDKDIETLNEQEKNDLMKKLKKVKNLKLTQNIALVLIPTIMVGAGVGIFFDKECGAFSDTYTVDYYSAYYQTEDDTAIKKDQLTRTDDLEEYRYILETTPWEKKENYYCRTCNYYDYDKNMDQERASEIINAGYNHVSEYGNKLITSKEEITTDKNYVEKTKEGEVAVSYLQKEFSREYKNTPRRKLGVATIPFLLSFITASSLALIMKTNQNPEEKDIKNKLKDLGYKPQRKSLAKRRKSNK